MEHKESVMTSEKMMRQPQEVCDRIEAVKGGIQEKLDEAYVTLGEIRNRPPEDVSRERYRLEKATLKLIEYYELELEQERIDIELAERNKELVTMGVALPGRQNTTASNDPNLDERYMVDNSKAAA